MFKYSNTNKRYHTFDYHLREVFGCKVAKISLDGGFTCPNIDGTKGVGGCIYCSNGGAAFAAATADSIEHQIQSAKSILVDKWNNIKYLAYFQTNTNTYAPIEKLMLLYESALAQKDIVGLCIATRADCINEEIADYLAVLSKKHYIIVELGLQTIHNETARLINRCHSYSDFTNGIKLLIDRGIKVCVHIINGLPNETKAMMLDTVRAVSMFPIHSVKIHLLHVLSDTKLADMFYNHEFELLSFDEYIDIVCDQIEILPPHIVIQRLTGDGDRKKLIGPMWSRDKRRVLNGIDMELVCRNSFQGDKSE